MEIQKTELNDKAAKLYSKPMSARLRACADPQLSIQDL